MDSEKLKKITKFGLIASVMMVAIAITILGMYSMSMVPDEVVTTIEADIPDVLEDTYSSGTSVTWHGTLDIFITSGETGIKEQVVFGEPNLITNIGADQIRGHLNGTVAAASIEYLSLSNDAGAASAAWTILPAEIAANGLERADPAAGLVNNGTGKFNITHTWTASATQSCQLIGTHWSATGELDGNLFSALKFTQQNLLVNDELEAVYSVEIS